MGLIPLLSLTKEQARYLYEAIHSYYGIAQHTYRRDHTTRKQILALLQRMLNKVQNAAPSQTIWLLLTAEEMTMAKKLTEEVLAVYASTPESPERHAMLAGLADLQCCFNAYKAS